MAIFTALVKIFPPNFSVTQGSWAQQNFYPAKPFMYTHTGNIKNYSSLLIHTSSLSTASVELATFRSLSLGVPPALSVDSMLDVS